MTAGDDGADLLAQPLTKVFGAATVKALRSLDLETVGDLLWHVPRRYAQRGELTDLANLAPGEQVTVLARVASVNVRPMQRRRGKLMDVLVTDGQERLRLTFFSVRGPQSRLSEGSVGLFAGKVDTYQGVRQLVHPEFVLLDSTAGAEDDEQALQFAGDLIPVYAATRSISSWRLAKAVATILRPLTQLPDPLPESVRRDQGLMGRLEALRIVHEPTEQTSLDAALTRLRFEEAFVLQVELARRRTVARALPATPRPEEGDGLLAAFDQRQPFPLTAAQEAVDL